MSVVMKMFRQVPLAALAVIAGTWMIAACDHENPQGDPRATGVVDHTPAEPDMTILQDQHKFHPAASTSAPTPVSTPASSPATTTASAPASAAATGPETAPTTKPTP